MTGDDKIIPYAEQLKWLIWLSRKIRSTKWGKNQFLRVRQRFIWGTVSQIHLGFAHSVRDFSIDARREGIAKLEPGRLLKLVESARDVICQFLEVSPELVHATIKLFGPSDSDRKEDACIHTIARTMHQGRPVEFFPNHFHLAGKNTSFAALLGCEDGRTQWSKHPLPVFHCPDLTKQPDYRCSRENWDLHFTTTLVLPLRYIEPSNLQHQFAGFLTFDSLECGLFSGVPNAFDHREKGCDTYNALLARSPLVHTTGILADILSTVLFLLASLPNPTNSNHAHPILPRP